ncbi:RNA polymerase sigma factor RpoD/SigA [Candidatus Woesearchaeota archaeon]|nr:RNA polymerase sigma factor RpoD/SigA [Candidatus Woesearchaeota archaeon]
MSLGDEYRDLQPYMHDISEIDLITPFEEIDLANEIQSLEYGSEEYIDSRNKLIAANLRLVVTIAKELSNRGLSLDELVSEGNGGLVQAAEKFEGFKGAKFSTYASWWIKQSMRRALREKTKTIRIPDSTQRKINHVKRLVKDLTKDLGREPTNYEVAKRSDFSARVVGKLRNVSCETISLDERVLAGEDDTFSDFVVDDSVPAPYDNIYLDELKEAIGEGLYLLYEREARIIDLRYGLNGKVYTLEVISEELNLTRERVRQIQKRALQKLKPYLAKKEYGNEKPEEKVDKRKNRYDPFMYPKQLVELLDEDFNGDLLELYKENPELHNLDEEVLKKDYKAFYGMMVRDQRYNLEFPKGFRVTKKEEN